MALIDYKFTNIVRDGRRLRLHISVYRGSFKDLPQYLDDELITVNRYSRDAKVLERTVEITTPQSLTKEQYEDQAMKYINKKIVDYATSRGHTVITEQTDSTGVLTMDSETGNL